MAYVNFMKINTSTGELMLKGSCPEEMVSIQKHAENELVFIPTEEQWTSITYDLYYYNGTEFVSRVYSPITKSGPDRYGYNMGSCTCFTFRCCSTV